MPSRFERRTYGMVLLACKDKGCAEKVEKKADKMLTDSAIKKHGEKGMELAFGVAMCLAQAKGE